MRLAFPFRDAWFFCPEVKATVVKNSDGGEPNAYLHGHGGIVRGLEEALEGRETGDTFSVTVTPEKAYGPRKAGAIQHVPIKHLIGAKRWKPGAEGFAEEERKM